MPLPINLPQISYQDFYSNKIDNLTLAQALQIHYELNPQFTKWFNYQEEILKKNIKSHDIAHIIFGCNTSLTGEMSVELWTLFANNLPKGEYIKLVKNSNINKEPFKIIKRIGYLKVLFVFTTNLWKVPVIWFASRKLVKKWPFFEEELLIGLTVGNIRKEYGIKV